MGINREGYAIIVFSVLAAALASAVCFIFLPVWLAAAVSTILAAWIIFTVIFFRKPTRPLLQDESFVFAPADGKIVVIEEVEEKEHLGQRMLQISVFMSLTNVHMNWYPVGGKVEYYRYHPGRFMVAWHPKSSEENERTTTVVDTGSCKVLFRQIAGLVARRIVSYAKEGEQVGQNSKCGFIKFGSRVDVLVPVGSEVLVKMNEMVIGSQTPIARLK